MCSETKDLSAARIITHYLQESETILLDNNDCVTLVETLLQENLIKYAVNVLAYINAYKIDVQDHIYVMVLKACGDDLETGKRVHFYIDKALQIWTPIVQSALLSFYIQCEDLPSLESLVSGTSLNI
jgi:hypothetical protein